MCSKERFHKKMFKEGEMMNIFKAILLMTSFLFSSVSFGAWSLRSYYEDVPNSETSRSVVEFKIGSNTRKEYRPEKPPWGLIDSQKFVLKDVTYFATIWSKGASSVLYRIFDMSNNRVQPICQFTSFAEKTTLRLKGSYLQVESLEDRNDRKMVWKNCSKID